MARKRLAVLVAGIEKEYQREYIRGLSDTARSLDADVMIFARQGYPEEDRIANENSESRIFDLPDLSAFDGVAGLINTIPDIPAAQRLEGQLCTLSHIPQVFLDCDGNYGTRIDFDDATSVGELMDHLIGTHGCRTFVLLTGPANNQVAKTRARVCRDKIAETGCTLLMERSCFWTRGAGIEAAAEVMYLNELPDAVVCANDDIALGVIDTLAEHGFRVPQDVIVTGFDGRRDAIARGLTTIRRPVHKAGEITAQLLLDGRRPNTLNRIMLPTEILLGSSCGCEACQEQDDFMQIISSDRRRLEQSLLRSAAFTSAMADVQDTSHAGQVFTRFAREWQIQEFYAVVNPDFLHPGNAMNNQDTAYRERMLMLSGVYNNVSVNNVSFDRCQLLPGLGNRKDPLALAFLPLYYQSRSIGYLALDLNYASSLAAMNLATMIDCTLMELSQRMTISRYVETLQNMSQQDILTGLLNRRGFFLKAKTALDTARSQRLPFVLLSADMDGMKYINDHYGHLTGDEAIRRMGRAMSALESRGIICAHMSGDEFIAAAVLSGSNSSLRLADALNEEIDRLNETEPWICPLGASIGSFDAVPGPEDTVSDFIRMADNRMYENKHQRKITRGENAF